MALKADLKYTFATHIQWEMFTKKMSLKQNADRQQFRQEKVNALEGSTMIIGD
jgi:hypothetical protein